MVDRALLMNCALGDVSIVRLSPNRIVLDPGMRDDFLTGDDKLPGGKFTAREFLEAYLNARQWAPVFTDCRNTQENMGSWIFTTKATEMAKAALEEWK